MEMETTSKTRTLEAYVSDLLQYPRWIIEREVDFTGCRYDGHYNAYLPDGQLSVQPRLSLARPATSAGHRCCAVA